MPRTRTGAARSLRKRRLFRKVKGYRGGRSKLYRTAKEAIIRSGVFAYRDRRRRKRDFRRLWITRLSAACRMRDVAYSRFIAAMQDTGIELNRKMLSEIAIHNPEDFDAIIEQVRPHIGEREAAA